MKTQADMAFAAHYQRVAAADEMAVVVKLNLTNGAQAAAQFAHYRSAGHAGEAATGLPYGSIIMRCVNCRVSRCGRLHSEGWQ